MTSAPKLPRGYVLLHAAENPKEEVFVPLEEIENLILHKSKCFHPDLRGRWRVHIKSIPVTESPAEIAALIVQAQGEYVSAIIDYNECHRDIELHRNQIEELRMRVEALEIGAECELAHRQTVGIAISDLQAKSRSLEEQLGYLRGGVVQQQEDITALQGMQLTKDECDALEELVGKPRGMRVLGVLRDHIGDANEMVGPSPEDKCGRCGHMRCNHQGTCRCVGYYPGDMARGNGAPHHCDCPAFVEPVALVRDPEDVPVGGVGKPPWMHRPADAELSAAVERVKKENA